MTEIDLSVQAHIQQLEATVVALQRELEETRAQVGYVCALHEMIINAADARIVELEEQLASQNTPAHRSSE